MNPSQFGNKSLIPSTPDSVPAKNSRLPAAPHSHRALPYPHSGSAVRPLGRSPAAPCTVDSPVESQSDGAHATSRIPPPHVATAAQTTPPLAADETPCLTGKEKSATQAFLDRAGEETHPPIQPPETPYAYETALRFRHSGWEHDRRRVMAALQTSETSNPRRLLAFSCCGQDATVQCCIRHKDGEKPRAAFRVCSTKCHDRFCLPCSRERANIIRHASLNYIRDKPNLSLITLGLLITDAPLKKQLDRVSKCFKQLRTKALWKKAVKGGMCTIEWKIAKDGKNWNVHMHIIAETKYMPQPALAAAWFNITGDSYIVDVRRVGARTGAVSYITKYVTKAADSQVVRSPAHLAEAIDAMNGRRLVSTFGAWRGLQLTEKCNEPSSYEEATHGYTYVEGWKTLGPIHEVLAGAAVGDPIAIAAIAALSPKRNTADR